MEEALIKAHPATFYGDEQREMCQKRLMDREPITVSAEVLEGIEAVRRGSEMNMLNLRVVQDVARRMGYHDTVQWIEDNPYLYVIGLIRSFATQNK